MEHENPTRHTIHSYDTQHHRIRCGIPGHTGASKHAGTVTCEDCRRLLDEVSHPASDEEGRETTH